MLSSLLAKLKKEEDGFTLIELLVVVLIIGILAAIALPTFLGQQDKAKDASAKSTVRNAITQMESCLSDGNNATYCASPTNNTDLAQLGSSVVVTASGTNGYSAVATSKAGSTHTYTIAKSDTTGKYTYTAGSGATGSAAWTANTST